MNAATVNDESSQYGVRKMDDIETATTTTNSDISRLNARYLAESAGGFKQFGDKVQIIAVSNDDEQKFEKVIQTLGKMTFKQLI